MDENEQLKELARAADAINSDFTIEQLAEMVRRSNETISEAMRILFNNDEPMFISYKEACESYAKAIGIAVNKMTGMQKRQALLDAIIKSAEVKLNDA